MNTFLKALTESKIIELVLIAVVMDTFFGAGRAIKNRSFNSSVGIDGAIRKISMLASLAFLAFVDEVVHINLIGFIPEEVRNYFPSGISVIELAEFFGMLYLCYEVVSILKNMVLCGLPVKKLWTAVRKFLGKYTEELPKSESESMGDAVTDTADIMPEGGEDDGKD